MRRLLAFALATFFMATVAFTLPSEAGSLELPTTVVSGNALSLSTEGSGEAVLYIVGPGQVLRRTVELGEQVVFHPGEIHNAGHYSVFLVAPSFTQSSDLDVTATDQASTLSFLAKPSRLPVDVHDGISGVVYVFDAFRNLITQGMEASFELSGLGGSPQTRSAQTQNGVAWVQLDSAAKAGNAQFLVHVGRVTEKRIVQEVPGDPCTLRISGHSSGGRIELETDPLRDCQGNAVPDGTIVTFKEACDGSETTVDVPLKRGVAHTTVPAYDACVISAATGVVMGNEIRWRSGR